MDFEPNPTRKLRSDEIAPYVDGTPVVDVRRVTEHITAIERTIPSDEIEEAVIRYALMLGRPMIIGDRGD